MCLVLVLDGAVDQGSDGIEGTGLLGGLGVDDVVLGAGQSIVQLVQERCSRAVFADLHEQDLGVVFGGVGEGVGELDDALLDLVGAVGNAVGEERDEGLLGACRGDGESLLDGFAHGSAAVGFASGEEVSDAGRGDVLQEFHAAAEANEIDAIAALEFRRLGSEGSHEFLHVNPARLAAGSVFRRHRSGRIQTQDDVVLREECLQLLQFHLVFP